MGWNTLFVQRSLHSLGTSNNKGSWLKTSRCFIQFLAAQCQISTRSIRTISCSLKLWLNARRREWAVALYHSEHVEHVSMLSVWISNFLSTFTFEQLPFGHPLWHPQTCLTFSLQLVQWCTPLQMFDAYRSNNCNNKQRVVAGIET